MAVNPLEAFSQGQGLVNSFATQLGQRQAGRALAQGDYASAMSSLFNSGDIGGGVQVQGLQQAAEQRQRSRQAEDGTRRLGVYKQVTSALRPLVGRGSEAVVAEFDRLSPILLATGATPEDIAPYREALATDAAGTVSTIDAAINKAEWQLRDGGAGDVVAVNPGTLETKLVYDAPDRPISTPYGIILPPNTGAGRSPAPMANGNAPVTGEAISPNALWNRQEQQESGGRQFASDGSLLTSPKGAFGVAQLMPGTAADLARQMGVSVQELQQNPELNRQAGQLYQSQQLEKYGGNQALALAAYNAGPGRVDQWLQQIGNPLTGEITTEEFVSRIPYAETKQYVQNITQGNYGSEPIEQGSEAGGVAQDLGGGWSLQAMQTPADRRAERSEVRADRADARAEEAARRAADAAARADQRAQRQEQNGSRREAVALRREFNNRAEVKAFTGVQGAYRGLEAAATGPATSGSDLSLIFQFMKILDPTSVVREGEFATAQNSGSAYERVGNLYNRVLNGTRLNARQRADFLQQGRSLYRASEQGFRPVLEQYRGYAEAQGISPDDVAPVPRGSQGQNQQPRTNAPGLRFNITESQLQTRQRLVQQGASPSAPLGSTRNPRYLNPADPSASYGNIPRGQHYVSPDGQIRQKR